GRAEQGERVRDVLDDVAADDDVGGGAAGPVVEAAAEVQPAAEVGVGADVGRVEAEADVIRPGEIDQTPQEGALAAADLDDAPAAHAAGLDQVAHPAVHVAAEGRRAGLR